MILKFAWKHIRSRPFSGLLTVIGASLVLTLLGSFWAIKDNLSNVQNSKGNESASINVFLKQESLNSDVKHIMGILNSSPIVAQSRIIAAEEALKELQLQFGETLSKAVSEDAIPRMINANLKPGKINREEVSTLINDLRKQSSVLEVDGGDIYRTDSSEAATETRIVNWAFVLFCLVFIIVALLISHIIRLAFEGNREDIETLKVLGASNFWIFGPILLEAVFYGILSVILTIICLNMSIRLLLPVLASHLLPKNFEFFSLSLQSWMGVVLVAMSASIIGALMTYPLIRKSAGKS